MPPWLRSPWYDLAYLTIYTGFTLGSSLRFRGKENMPRTGPVLAIANHQSFFDPILVGVASPRRLKFLARKTLFRQPAFGALLRSFGTFPIDQDGVGKEGLRTVIQQLTEGRAVLVFPEGTRTPHGRLDAFQPGIHLLLRKMPVPVVPVGIAGATHAWPPHRKLPRLAPLFLPPTPATISVSVGRPLDGKRYASLPREQALSELGQRVQEEMDRAEKLRRKR